MSLFGKKKPAAKKTAAKKAPAKKKAGTKNDAAAIAAKMREKSKNGECAFC